MAGARNDIGQWLPRFDFNDRGIANKKTRTAADLGDFQRIEPDEGLATTVSDDIKNQYYDAIQQLNQDAIQMRYYGIDVTNPDPTDREAVAAAQAWHDKYNVVRKMAEELKTTRSIEEARWSAAQQGNINTPLPEDGRNLTYRDMEDLTRVDNILTTIDKFTGDSPNYYTEEQVSAYNQQKQLVYDDAMQQADELEANGRMKEADLLRGRANAMLGAFEDVGAQVDDAIARQRADDKKKDENRFDWLKEYTTGASLGVEKYVSAMAGADRTYTGKRIAKAEWHPAQGGREAYIQLYSRNDRNDLVPLAALDPVDNFAEILTIFQSAVPLSQEESKLVEGWMESDEWKKERDKFLGVQPAEFDEPAYTKALDDLITTARTVTSPGKDNRQELKVNWLDTNYRYFIQRQKAGGATANRWKLVIEEPDGTFTTEFRIIGRNESKLDQTETLKKLKPYMNMSAFNYNPITQSGSGAGSNPPQGVSGPTGSTFPTGVTGFTGLPPNGFN